jgi:maleylacetoacetate isomerase
MDKVVLYDYWRSSSAYRVRLALSLKGLDYELVPVNLLTGEHRSAEHLARNPQGLVPVLEIDGLRLTQSLAIIEYLDETRPYPRLLPEDAAGRARVRALSYAIAMEIHPICNLGVAAHVAELTRGGDEAKAAWMRHFIGTRLKAYEALLDDPRTGRFCYGDAPSMADCCLVPQLYNARRWGVDFTRLQRIWAIDKACQMIGAIEAAHPDKVGAPT